MRRRTQLSSMEMDLTQLSSPEDLRGLTYEQLDALCGDIRQFIVDAVSANGGHLGSNLGVVELTVALHRVFSSPRDVILFDTGHQSYVHKILTGRASEFDRLRKAGGLSGYPDRTESEHDWIENSHASTVLSWAHGMATALEAGVSEHDRVVAVVGDGAMTGGMAFEGLNNLGHSGRKVTIILNDNGRSYAPTVSKLGESLARLRINPTFVRQYSRIEKIIGDLPVVGSELERAVDATKAAVREMWEPTSFFENLGVFYTGPFDGHDIPRLEEALRNAAELDGPAVVHVRTEKGRGYAPAENDAVNHMHDGRLYSVPKPGDAKPASYTAAFTDALIKAGEEHPNLVAITAAMPDSTGLLSFSERFPDRCFDVGIAEQHAVTAAAGMAMGGLRPVVAVYATFLTRAIDQVNLDVGLHGQPVIFCLDRAGITGPDGASHHGILDMVLMSKVPGMTIFAPSSLHELPEMFETALTLDGPCALRWPRTAARVIPETEIGSGLQARKVTSGSDVCIISVGKMLEYAEEAAALLAAEGVSASIWDARIARPLDQRMIADAAEHPLVVTVEDGIREGGIGAMARDQLSDTKGDPRVRVMGVPVSYIPHGDPVQILAELGLDGAGIRDEILRYHSLDVRSYA